MLSQRHAVRKLDFSESNDFDERLWPVNLALLLAWGCVAGMIWAAFDFQTPVVLENGYFWLFVLTASVLTCGVLAIKVGGRSARRLQMAAFLSLALHGIGLAYLKVGLPASALGYGPPSDGGKRELRAIDFLPDYHLTRALPNRPQDDIEKPVETKLPDKLALEAIQPQPRAPRAADVGPLTPKDNLVAIADPAPRLIAPPIERKPIEPAAPRRGDLDAQLAKQQPSTVTAPAAGPIKAIDLSVPTTKPGPLEARTMPLGRQTTDPKAPRRPEDTVAMISGLMQPGGPRSAPAPRTNDQPSPLVAAGPRLVKTITEPGSAPRGDAPTPASAAKAAVPDLNQLLPATGIGRQAPAGAVVGRTGMELASAAPLAAPRVALPSRQPIVKPSNEPSVADSAAAPRTAPRAASPAAGPIADLSATSGQTPSRMADGGPGPGPLGPTIQVTRGTPAAGAPMRPIAPALNGAAGAGGFGVTVAMAGPQPGRAQDAAGPRPDASLPFGGPVGSGKPGFAGIGRSATVAPVAGLPAAGPPGGIEGTAGKSAPSSGPMDGPSRVGIAKSSGGKVGPGRGEGFDAGGQDAAPQVSIAAAVGSGGGASSRSGDGPGVSGGPAIGIGQPGGLARSAAAGAAPIGAMAISPVPGDVRLAGGSGPVTGSVEVASLIGTQHSEIGGPIGKGNGPGGSGSDDTAGAQPSLNVGIGAGSGGGPGRLASSNEQPTIGLGTGGQQLPRAIGGNGGNGGTATVAGSDVAAAAALPGGSGSGGPGGAGGDGNGPGGPIADSRATGAMRTAPGSGIPGGAPIAGRSGAGDGPGGDGSGGGNGQIGAAQIGRPGSGSEEMPGGIVGGVPGGLGSGIGRAGRPAAGSLAGEVQGRPAGAGTPPQLAAGSPTGGSDRGTGTGGNGPGGDGSGPNGQSGGIDGPSASVERQASGGLPSGGGAGKGEGAGQPGVNVAGVLGGAQIGAASGEGAPGISGNGDGGPTAIGAGLGGVLPKSNAVGVPGSMDVPGADPQFAGSPATVGPGNNARGSAGGPGGDGPGGPGGIGPGGDGTGRRFGNAGLPTPNTLAGSPDGTAASGVPQFGLPDRRALPDSDQVAISSGRFLQRQAGGGGPEVAADAPTRAPTPSFLGRGREGRGGKGDGDGIGSDGRTEQTIELGLAYLAQMQLADGSWSLHRFLGATEADVGSYRSDTAATGLALLGYLGAGYDHFDDKYHNTVRRGLEYLVSHQKADGDLFLPMDQDQDKNRYARLYSHAIATIAVCEALGMTGDKRLREPAQKAINFIVASQDKGYGGWRYNPGQDSDTSVTGWQTTALKSGELAGLNVPRQAYEHVARWLDSAQVAPNDGSRYIYRPQDPQSQDPRDSRRPTMTSVALLTRIYLGWKRDNPELLRGADFIKANLPRVTDPYSRDTYYWYYATQVMFQLKGDYWRIWSERLHPLLINSQISTGPLAGSWDPQGPIPDRWGFVGGRMYVTTMNLLSLEVYYRHLPIYEVPEGK